MAKMKPQRSRPLFTPTILPGSKADLSIRQSNKRLNIWEGSVRSGKTISSIIRWLAFVLGDAPEQGELVMTGKTNKTTERNILSPIVDMLGVRRAYFNRGTSEFHISGLDRPIHIISANDESAQEKIRGMTIAGMYGDEITLWPESYFKMGLSRLSVRGAKFFGTTNPDSPYHWLKTDYLDEVEKLAKAGGLARFHFTLDDNPMLDPLYVQSLKLEYTGLWYRRFILGQWCLAEGTVYDMWDEDKHVINVQEMLENQVLTGQRREPRFRYYFVSADYGTNNACTFGLFGHDGRMPVYLCKEYYFDSVKAGRQKTDSQYGADFEDFVRDYPRGPIYIDPSALSFISELRHRGFRISEAKNDVLDGIRFVGSMLSKGYFFVDKGCKHTIQEFASYVWDPKSQQKGEDKPLKQHDHAMDRTRYALFSHFFREHKGIITSFNYS